MWATAPYFHNGSVPTLAGVLNSRARPKVFTRSFKTDEADYDKANVGWKVTECDPPDPKASGFERRKVYDTTRPGRGNGGRSGRRIARRRTVGQAAVGSGDRFRSLSSRLGGHARQPDRRAGKNGDLTCGDN